MADFPLVVELDYAASLANFKSGISQLINSLNSESYKIKVELDTSLAKNSAQNIKSEINSIASEASRIAQGIPKIDINLGLSSNPIQKSAAYGASARRAISQMREQAEAMTQELNKYIKAANQYEAVAKALQQGGGLTSKFFDVSNAAFDTKRPLNEQISALQEWIEMIQKAASLNNIDLSNVTSQYSSATNEIVENTERIASGKAEIDNLAESLRTLFGGGVTNEALVGQFDRIHEAITQVVEAIQNLGSSAASASSGLSEVSSGADAAKQEYEQVAEAVNETKTAVVNLKAESSSVNIENGAVSISQQYKQAADAIGESAEALSELNAEASSAGTEKGAEDIVRQYKQAADAIRQARDVLASNMNASEMPSYAPLMNELNTLEHFFENCGADAETFRDLLKDAGVDGASSIEQLKAHLSALKTELQSVGNEGTVSLQQLKTALTQAQNLLDRTAAKNPEMVNTDQFRALQEMVAEYSKIVSQVEEALRTETDETVTETDKLRDAFQNLKTDATGAVESIKSGMVDLKYATSQAAESEEQAEKRRRDAINQTNKLLREAYEIQQKISKAEGWTKSKNGTTSEEYNKIQSYRDAINGLVRDLQQGKMAPGEFADRIKEIGGNIDGSISKIREAGEATSSIGSRFQGLMEKFSMWFGASRIIMEVVRGIRDAIKTSIELNDSLTQMQIVTGASADEMERFSAAAVKAAKETGAKVTDIVSGATTYARLGYSEEDATALAKYTAMLQNVGNIDASAAQDAITAIVKAYDDIDVGNIEAVMDKLIATGNNFPISVSQIAEGMNNASSALAAAGNTFEESVALLTAANTTIQDAARSSTGLRTIAARIRNTKTELDELGEEPVETATYEKLIQTLTKYKVSLTDVNGEYRSTYDIIKDLAAQWGNMTSMEQAAVATAMSGTRQQAVFYSLVNNFKTEAEGAMKAMQDSAGALNEANSIYMESMSAKIAQVKADWAQMAQTFITSDLVSFFTQIASAVVNVLNVVGKAVNALGGLKTVLLAVGASIAIAKADSIAKTFTALGTSVRNVVPWFKKLAVGIAEGMAYTDSSKGAFERMSTSLNGVGISASAAQLKMAAFIGVIAAGVIAIKLAKKAHDDYLASLDKTYSDAMEKAQKGENLYSLYSEYETAKNSYDENAASKERLTQATQALRDALVEEGGAALKASADLNQLTIVELQKAQHEAEIALIAQEKKLKDVGKRSLLSISEELGLLFQSYDLEIPASTSIFDDTQTAVEKTLAAYKQLIELRDKMLADKNTDNVAFDAVTKLLDKLSVDVGAYTEAVELLDLLGIQIDNVEHGTAGAASGIEQTGTAAERSAARVEALADALGRLKSNYEILEKARTEMQSGGLTEDTISSIVKAVEESGGVITDYLYEENGAIKLNTELWEKNAQASRNADVDGIKERLSLLKDERAQLEADLAQWQAADGRFRTRNQRISELNAALAENSKEIAYNESLLALYGNLYLSASEKVQRLTTNYHNLTRKLYDTVFAQEALDAASMATARDTIAQLDSVSRQIAQYKLLEMQLEGATDAFVEFNNAQAFDTETDFRDELSGMIEAIHTYYNDNMFGADGFWAAFNGLVPEDVYSQFTDVGDQIQAGMDYIDNVLSRYYTNDNGKISIEFEGVKNFVEDALSTEYNGSTVFEGTIDDFTINSDITTLEELADAMGITTTAAFALGNAISLYTADNDDFLTRLDIESLSGQILNADKNLVDLLKHREELATAGKIDTDEWIENGEAIQQAKQDLDDLGDQAREQITANIEVDTNIEEAQAEVDRLYDRLQGMSEGDAGYSQALAQYRAAEAELAKLLQEKAELGVPTEVVIQLAIEDIEAEIAKVEADLERMASHDGDVYTVRADTGYSQEEVDELVTKLNTLQEEKVQIEVYAGLENEEDVEQELNAIEEITIHDKKFSVVAFVEDALRAIQQVLNAINNLHDKTVTITTNQVTNNASAGGSRPHAGNSSVPMAQAYGNARARGQWGGDIPGGNALVGELGEEIVVDPNTGRYQTVGEHGAEIVRLPRGAIVFNHKQTEGILKNRRINSRGKAYVNGNTRFILIDPGGSGGGSGSGGGGGGGYGGGYNASSYDVTPAPAQTSSGSSDYGDTTPSKGEEEKPTVIDWIEIAIDRIERAITKLGRIFESSFRTLTTRLKAADDEIYKVRQEIVTQESGYKRYMMQANSVGLSPALAEKVRNGTININEYDSATAEKIQEYQKWYEAALDCKDAMEELKETLSQLYVDKFDAIAKNYEDQLSLLEHLTTSYDNGLSKLEEQGYMASSKYYEAQAAVQKQNIAEMTEELKKLQIAMSDAVNHGDVAEGSEAWYQMQQEINGVKESIQEASIELIKLNNAIRELEWERFDFAQDRISKITEEANFLIGLMENDKLYTDNGQFTGTGITVMGLHGQNYNVYMQQASEYADEIRKIDKELAKDPYNTKLLERREELLKAQQDSIQAAEDEKDAIADMVREGIELELDALQRLIDSYTSALDRAKDLYDYQKKIKDQTSEIASLQKQLSAYSGDTSEEAKATIQKLTVSLNEAKVSLEDTQYEHYISEQKALLDELYTEYETVLNTRLDDIDALLIDMIAKINDNAGVISLSLQEQAGSVGYTLSTAMSDIWNDGENGFSAVLSPYFNGVGDKLTSINSTISNIHAFVSQMKDSVDQIAVAEINGTSATTDTVSTPAPESPSAPPVQTGGGNYYGGYGSGGYGSGGSGYGSGGGSGGGSGSGGSGGGNVGTVEGVAMAIWLHGNASGWGNGQDRSNKLTEKLGSSTASSVQGYINNHGPNGDLYNMWNQNGVDLTRFYYNAFLHGGLIDYTGPAWVDGSKSEPEMVLSAEDTKNFISLRDAMRKIQSGSGSLAAIFNGQTPDILSRLSEIDVPNVRDRASIGDVSYQINIPIEHVNDYDDFVNQLRRDGKFEKMIRSMTIDRLAGASGIAKNHYQW